MASGVSDAFRHCMDELRAGDRERYLSVLFAPAERRPALAALYAYNLELARVRDRVSEPMPGEIRLQWWQEVVSGEREGEGRQHPVAALLLDAVDACGLSRPALANMAEARIFDLYDDPMPDRTALEGYLGETVSALFQMSAQILDPSAAAGAADAAGHAGVAYGIAGLMGHAPLHRARNQVYVPGDVLAAAGTDAAAWLAGEDRDAMARVTTILVSLVHEHLSRAETGLGGLPASLKPAFLPLAVVKPLAARLEKAGAAHAREPVTLSPLRLHWLYLRRVLAGAGG
ncbi:phytoene/squalene synthase family protein [Oricola thermophila]|uniref:Phytoene/squalene synthase family protein n=1 Tax=Oricola thermophila TaxID=2742145 RepID=A0A6N1VIC6_9HYPH|nr:phytoene/squalene synthase family protein [Oricola thermophila]QKV20524.1 phytoene/squalene synthase family protein [Oricola thermophila]